MPRFCEDGGATVGAEYYLPDDPRDYGHPLDVPIGCNRLVCMRCGQPVRQCPGVGTAGAQEFAPVIYFMEDWGGLPKFAPSRLYACACFTFGEMSCHYMQAQDFDPVTDPTFPWRCSGHPDPTLPLEVDGIQIEERTDILEIAIRALRDGPPPMAPLRSFPARWLCRLYWRLEGLPIADSLVDAVRLCLRSKEFVGDGLEFYGNLPRLPGFDEVLRLATANQGRYACQEFRCHGPDDWMKRTPLEVLAARVRSGLTIRDELDSQSAAILQDFATRAIDRLPMECLFVLKTLAQWDPSWLAENAARIAKGSEALAFEVLQALCETECTTDHIRLTESSTGRFLRAAQLLTKAGVVDLGAVLRWVRWQERMGASWFHAIRLALTSRSSQGRKRR